MTRIRYKLDGPELRAGPFFANKLPIYATIIPDEHRYYIDDHENNTYNEWDFCNLTEAKKEIREHLMNLGVVFAKERRIFKK